MKNSAQPPKNSKNWKQLGIILIELLFFLAAWALILLGVFSGYFAVILVITLGIIIFYSIFKKSEDE